MATFAAGTATYTYDATGNKLRKVDLKSGATTTTDYINGIEYDNSTTTIGFIQTEEGKAVPTATGGYDYTYYLGDNLGNTRVTFDTQTGAAVALQQDDYYPFGLEINHLTNSPKNEYLYNKKELQEETQEYDYGHRYLDPLIGRWTTIDPDIENNHYEWSPYVYVYNDPIRLNDPDGRDSTKKAGSTPKVPNCVLCGAVSTRQVNSLSSDDISGAADAEGTAGSIIAGVGYVDAFAPPPFDAGAPVLIPLGEGMAAGSAATNAIVSFSTGKPEEGVKQTLSLLTFKATGLAVDALKVAPKVKTALNLVNSLTGNVVDSTIGTGKTKLPPLSAPLTTKPDATKTAPPPPIKKKKDSKEN